MTLSSVSNGELLAGGLSISKIAEDFGTPLFVYDAGLLDQQWRVLRETYPSEFAISYSVKANPNPVILKFFLARGSGLEIASAGEFHLARHAGCPAERILFAGPGKTVADLELVLGGGIGEIHVESTVELERISVICRKLAIHASVAVRVNPSEEAQGGAMRMGGKPLPFGVDEEILDGIIARIAADPCLDLCGLHLFTGTQILDPAVLIRQYKKGIEIALRVARILNRPLRTLDFGGGLGVPYFSTEKPLDMQTLGSELEKLMIEVRSNPLLTGTRFMLEPGRFLVAGAGLYLARVTDVKLSRGKKFVIIDGGMNHHLAASGNLGQVIKRNFPIAVVNKMNDEPKEIVDVVGPLCTPLDVLAREVNLPQIEVGDLIGVQQSGAYARTASPQGFLSHLTPAEVLVEDGTARLIRRRGTFCDLVADVVG